MQLRSLTRSLVVLAAPVFGASGQATLPPLTIGGAARAAAERSAVVDVARERASQADARVRQRRADLLPSITGSASDAERTINSATLGISFRDPVTGQPAFDPNGQVLGPIKAWDFRATIRQSLADPAAVARLSASKAVAAATLADVSSVAQQAAATAALACVAAMRATAQLSARIADSALAADLLSIARAQLDAGTGIALDVTRAEAVQATTRAQLIAARISVTRSRMDLARALGLPATTPVTLAGALETVADAANEDSADAAAARALDQRADLRAAGRQLAAAERQVRAVRAERFPALSAFVNDGAIGKTTNHLLNTWSWGIQLGIPVFDGFRREGRIAEQRAVIREIEVRRRELSQQVDADVRTSLLELDAAREQLAAALERNRLAVQEVEQARERFAAGVSGNADVITASLNLNAARTFVVDARTALLTMRVAVARAQGTVTALP